ncbi:MAG TPA: MFS transporter [Marmoricola sp.]|nr:MFS transporter [Marmoricola sp.]
MVAEPVPRPDRRRLAPIAPVPRSRIAPGTVLLVASFGAFLAFLDATVVNVAFPDIRESFPDTSISGLSWVLNAYNIVFASFLIVFGRLGDLLGRRRMFSWGIVTFSVSSLLCAVAPSLDLLVAARTLQAAGAAMLVPASLAIIIEAFPADRRSHAVGLWGASAAVAAGLGPPIGGALVEVGSWRWAFLVNLPFGLVAWHLARTRLVESRAPGRRRLPDLRGALLLAAALSLLTLGIVQGNDWGWASAGVLGSLTGAVLLGAGFVTSSRAHAQPLLDPALLRIGPFMVSNGVTVLAGMGFYAYMLTNILWLQYVWGYEILTAGLALVPGALIAAVVAARLGPVAQRHGYRRVVVPGALVWAAAYLWYAVMVGAEPAFWAEWMPGQVLSGIGVGATLPVLGSAALAAVPGGRFGTASAVVSSTRQLGGVLGIAVLVVIIGSPTPVTAESVLRDGWLFCALCFVLAAAGGLGLRTVVGGSEASTSDGAAAPIAVHVPGRGPAEVSERADEAGDEPGDEIVAESPMSPILQETYLSRLPEQVRQRFESSGSRAVLGAGDWLFAAGDPAEAMYVVSTGRLEVVLDGEVIRELGPGAILGELALLTGGARSASVRARRDSSLLRVSREEFLEAMAHDPAAPMAVATALAEQLASPRPADEGRSSRPVVVSVVGLSPAAPVAAVTDALVAGLRRGLRVLATTGMASDGLARAERDFDRVVLSAPRSTDSGTASRPSAPDEWCDFCVRQADQAVLVARSEDLPDPDWAGPGRPDLVLVGPRPSGDEIARWCEAIDPWQITVVDEDDLAGGLRGLVARIAGRALGLVLAGGGARAMTHIGVLHELADAGLVVDRVAGCSLGSIVAGLHARGHDAEEVEAICYEEFVRHKPFGDYTLPLTGLAKGRRKNAALRRRLGADTRIADLPHQFRCVSTDLLAREPYVHRRGLLWEAVAASARLPVLFPPLRSGGRLLVDGGVLDNLPVGLLTERDEGPVVAVNIGLGGSGSRTVDPDRPLRVPALGETLLRTMMIGSGGATERARACGAYVISPPSMGVGMLEFHQMDRMVEAGRVAARALLEATGGDLSC